MKYIHFLFFPTCLRLSAAFGALTTGVPFADNMVLQRDRPVPVWGTSQPNETIQIRFAGQTVSTTSDDAGNWKAYLPAFSASTENRDLVIRGKTETVTLRNVLVGEVWLCSGQSNMDMPLVHDTPRWGDNWGALIAQTARRPHIRMACAPVCWSTYEKRLSHPLKWDAFTPEYLRSGRRYALACYWGLDLYEAIGIPIGLIAAAEGGSAIDPWIPAIGFKSVPSLYDLAAYSSVETLDDKQKTKLIPHPGQQPCVKWNATFEPIAPFAVRGAIWYQGESNAFEPERYCDKMHALYNGWSKKFENDDFKLYFVQLAPWGFEDIADIQMAQARFAAEERRSGMAVINDLGDLNDIHPDNKLLVSKRLVQHALKNDYGFTDIEAESPTPASWTVKDGCFILRFAHARRLYIHNPERTLDANFEIAGRDGIWHPATVINADTGKISWSKMGNVTNDYLIVRSDLVDEPRALRHLHLRPWRGCLYNEVGLPAGAFVIHAEGPRRFNELYRPQFHFSAPHGWINDPNGLVYRQGVWHLCYQHNPKTPDWDSLMNWGHAVSTDLIHWKDQGDVLFPSGDKGCWSGSSFRDTDNRMGLGKDTILSLFTRNGSGQDLAWSSDGCTWTPWSGNPSLPLLDCEHRDPMVFFHQPSGKWVMVLFVMKDGCTSVGIFNSTDMQKWTWASTVRGDPRNKPPIGVWGDKRDWLYECPNLVEVRIRNSQETKWVLFDASCNYAIGDFDGSNFKPEVGPIELLPTREKVYYAAQTFACAPDKRCVWIAWYKVFTATKCMPFNQQLSLPCDLSLVRSDQGLRLCVMPVKELESLRDGPSFELGAVEGDSLELLLDCKIESKSKAAFDIRGVSLTYDAASRMLDCNGTAVSWPLSDGRFKARIFVDRIGFEIFSDDGRIFPRSIVCNPKCRKAFAIPGDGVSDCRHRVWPLKSIYVNGRP